MAKIIVKKNGPLVVKGVDELFLHNGLAVRSKKRGLVLCRCGYSNTKPLCDGAHRDREFDNDFGVHPTEGEYHGTQNVLDNDGGHAPNIIAEKNGPFTIYNCEVVSVQGNRFNGTGRTLKLCRCGQSNNKPYCDGTHIRNNWDDSNTSF